MFFPRSTLFFVVVVMGHKTVFFKKFIYFV